MARERGGGGEITLVRFYVAKNINSDDILQKKKTAGAMNYASDQNALDSSRVYLFGMSHSGAYICDSFVSSLNISFAF